MKPDIFRAVKEFVTCRVCTLAEDNQLQSNQQGCSHRNRSSSVRPIGPRRISFQSRFWWGTTSKEESNSLSLDGSSATGFKTKHASTQDDEDTTPSQPHTESGRERQPNGLEDTGVAGGSSRMQPPRDGARQLSSREFWPSNSLVDGPALSYLSEQRGSSTASDPALWEGEHINCSRAPKTSLVSLEKCVDESNEDENETELG